MEATLEMLFGFGINCKLYANKQSSYAHYSRSFMAFKISPRKPKNIGLAMAKEVKNTVVNANANRKFFILMSEMPVE